MAEIGFALDRRAICDLARRLATELRLTSFKASRGWYRRYLARFPELRTRIAQNFDRLRAGGMNKNKVVQYFNLLQKARFRIQQLSGLDVGAEITPNRIWNLDEVGFE